MNINREIKFRVFDKKTQQMLHDDDLFISLDGRVYTDYYDTLGGCGDDDHCGGVVKIGETKDTLHLIPILFTGLTDKNDREIYEGDIIKRYGGGLLGNNRLLFIGEVVLTKNGYKAKYTKTSPGSGGKRTETAYGNIFNKSEREVIGNIYENPELLEHKCN